ncbi:hypothetical protein AAFF_G00299140 [Aldrovandia affinis]|uniref:Uncharacterized protein n=1 Tax=Aldrovandia affinis TaxID=143900 RepID=A0AAD7RB52_9TELE|nr:hypothetical protein AAFF_G00299140 [Aldrovandia affinis]
MRLEESSKGSHVSDFEFSFTPTSLMEEIFTGREWSHFLALRRSPVPMETASQSQVEGRSWAGPGQRRDAPPELRASGTISSRAEPAANQEANEHMLVQSGTGADGLCGSWAADRTDQSRERIPEGPLDVFTKPVEVLDNSASMSRAHLNRKREHQSGTRRESRRQSEGDGAGPGEREGVGPGEREDSTVNASLQTAEGAKETDDNTIPLYVLPSALRSSAAHDSSTSGETVIKKRKIKHTAEGARRVRFMEQPEFLPDVQPFEFTASEIAEPSVLPGWILALKRKAQRRPR